ncbi:MAG: DUF402 domain-containing protein [Bacilli bacterium]|nr:DUF402 domain-containing protein [Bacilli bacterium]
MRYVGKWLGIKCFKHDGALHRIWDRGLVLDNNDDFLVCATKSAKVVESNGRRWFTSEPAVTIFSKKEWWNVICMFKNDGICYYCNIASPCVVDNGNIKYIDYDLDVKLFPDKSIRVLDEKEYDRHKEQYKYSEKLDSVLKFETENIIEKMGKREFPFKDEIIKEYYDNFLSQLAK